MHEITKTPFLPFRPMRIERVELDEWGRMLPPSGVNIFHRPEVLSVLDEYSDADLQLLGGFKGEEPVACLPVFIQESVIGQAVFSPPPSMGIPYLGPLLSPASPKRSKIERVNWDFTREIVDELGLDSRFTLFRIIGAPKYSDPRPFHWAGHRVETKFTYVLEVPDDPDDLLGDFSRDLRRDVRDGTDLDLTVSVEDEQATERVTRDVMSRYEEQNETPPITPEYVRELIAALGDRARTYVARDTDGSYLGGIIVLYSDDTAYFWQGGVSQSYKGRSVNSLVHWHIIQDIASSPSLESVTNYDLVGANTQRLCKYKVKFGGNLVPYYVVESSGSGMTVAKKAYQMVRT